MKSFKFLPRSSSFIAATIALALNLSCLLPAKADWRNDIGTFRIGMIVGNDVAGDIAKVEPFRLAISEALGLDVEIFAANNYRTLIDAHVAARIEYAIYSASAYAAAWSLCECIEPLVLPKTSGGSDSYQSIVISSDNGPKSIEELAGSKLAGLSKSSFAGYRFAAYELKLAGIELSDNIGFGPTGEQTITQFMAGEYDALIGWSSLVGDPLTGYSHGTLNLIANLNNGKTTPYRVIWKSSPIPQRPHVIRKSLAGEAKRLLRDALTSMYGNDPVAYDSIEPVFGGGFVAARHQQFLPVINYLATLKPAPKETAPEAKPAKADLPVKTN